MGHDQHGAVIVLQMVLEPGHAFRVQMVGRFVKQQHVRLGQEQLTDRHPAAFTARQITHVRIRRRAAQRVHGHLDLGIHVPGVARIDLLLQLGHLLHQLVGIILGELHGDGVVGVIDLLVLRPFDDVFPNGLGLVELGLLGQIPHAHALLRPGFPGEVGVLAGHDAQQRGFTCAVDAHDADLGVRQEVQRDAGEDLFPAGIGLRQIVHVIDVLIRGHRRARSISWGLCSSRTL